MDAAKRLASLFLIFGAILFVAAFFTLGKMKTQYSVMQFLPSHHPSLEMDREVRKKFHLEDRPLFIGVLTLSQNETGTWLEPRRIRMLTSVTRQIEKWGGIFQVLDIANVQGASDSKDALKMGTLLSVIPVNTWRSEIQKNKLLTPSMISRDGRTVLIFVETKDATVELLVETQSRLRELLRLSFPKSVTSIGGVPAVQTDLGLLLNKELVHFLLLSLFACAGLLMLIFESWTTFLIPLALTAFCNVMVFSMMALTGITFTILSSTIPILVFITVVAHTVYSLLRFHEDIKRNGQLHREEERWRTVLRTSKSVLIPNLLGALTTCIGFLTLLTGDVPLIRDYGLTVALSVFLAWGLTTFGIVPFLILLPLPRPRSWVGKPARWALWIFPRKKEIVVFSLALTFLFGILGSHLRWTARLFDDLPKGQSARRTTEMIDRSMGGVIPVEVVIQGGVSDYWSFPENIRTLDRFLQKTRSLSGVGTARSLPEFLRSSQKKGQLPTSRAALAEVYFLYSLAERNPLQQYMIEEGRTARVELKLQDLPSDRMKELVREIAQEAQRFFPGAVVKVGGMGAVVHIVQDEISRELIFGFWQALVLIGLILVFVFRSLRWALLACIPNLIPPIVLLGFLALTRTAIKPGVAIIFSIALGLAFNNTIYVLNRLRALQRHGTHLPIRRALYLEGNPCLISTLIIMVGFSVFLFSYFSLNVTFGVCMMISILAGLLGDLVFMPALIQAYPALLHDHFRPHPSSSDIQVLHFLPEKRSSPNLPIEEEYEKAA